VWREFICRRIGKFGVGVVGSTRNIVVQLGHQIFGLAEDESAAHEGLWFM
jgi:hypothetical protein